MAQLRAGLPRLHSPDGDPRAQGRLCAGMDPAPLPARMLPALAARTRFFDEQVQAAVADGIRQIVVLGAGYDDRALRFRTPGTRFFELDHPATQEDKARRLRKLRPAAGPVLAPVDFRDGDCAAVLASCGHDAGRPSLFVGEGLLVYLDRATVVGLLGALRSRSTRESRLAVSLAVHREGLDSDQVMKVANTRRATGRSEPWLSILPLREHLDLLARAGWEAEHTVDARELNAGAEPGKTILVAARPGE